MTESHLNKIFLITEMQGLPINDTTMNLILDPLCLSHHKTVIFSLSIFAEKSDHGLQNHKTLNNSRFGLVY